MEIPGEPLDLDAVHERPTRKLIRSFAHIVWEHQQQLRAHPDPADEWWFLVDPDAGPPRTEP